MAARYKTTTLNGKPILSHRKVWVEINGEIPDGMHVHHKNDNKFDNRIENLELMTAAAHTVLHSKGREAWNKGIEYGKTAAYKKSNANRKANYEKLCEETFRLWKDGRTQNEVAEFLGVSRRQVCYRLRAYRQLNNLPNE